MPLVPSQHDTVAWISEFLLLDSNCIELNGENHITLQLILATLILK
jgi:hypothetical protein